MTGKARGAVELAGLALRLGRTNRSSLHPDGTTPESVTDHTVMLGWMACAWAARFRPDLDVGLVAEYASVHDAVEAYALDTSTLRLLTAAAKEDKARREREAFDRIAARFGDVLPWLVDRIAEYEENRFPEARWVRAADKIVVKATHVLNGCAAPRRAVPGQAPMTVDELRERYDTQYTEVFGLGGYGADFPELAEIYRELVTQELAVFAGLPDV